MPSLYNIALVTVSVAHLIIGAGNLLKLPPLYKPENWMIGDNVGTGDTGIEKLMEAIMAGWYTSSIIAVLVAYFTRFHCFNLVDTDNNNFLVPELASEVLCCVLSSITSCQHTWQSSMFPAGGSAMRLSNQAMSSRSSTPFSLCSLDTS